MMNKQLLYYGLTSQEQDLALGYIVSILLRSRRACGLSQKTDSSNDDLDVYISNLLVSLTDSKAQERISKYVFSTDAELVQKIEESKETFSKYQIYKTNADNILVSLGLFDNFKLRNKEGKIINRRRFRGLTGRGKIYYELAGSYHRRIYRRRTAICDVLDKMSVHFEEYLGVLTRMKKDLFAFTNKIADIKFEEFGQSLRHHAAGMAIAQKQDMFLDAYNKYKMHRDKKREHILRKSARDLEGICPYFKFDIERFLKNKGRR